MTLTITNQLGYTIEQLPMLAPNGADIFQVVAKVAHRILPNGDLVLDAEYPPIQLEDEHWGDEGTSAIRRETDAALSKPFTDLLVLGHVMAPGGVPAKHVGVGLAYNGRVLRKLRATGDRMWFDRGLGWSMTSPTPFVRMPLSFDRAFGGMDAAGYEKRNRLGRGYATTLNGDFQGRHAPNIEHVDSLVTSPRDRPDPAGMGVIGRDWTPRVGWAGTYNAAWEESRYPLLPVDFDMRFNHTAHPVQWIKEPKRGDTITLSGMNAERVINFQLPDPVLHIGFFFVRKPCEKRHMHLSTILVDTDALRLELTWTATVDVHGDPFQLVETVISNHPVTPRVAPDCGCA